MGLVLSPDDKTLYVTLGRAGAVAVMDVASRAVTRTMTGIGQRPWGIAINPAGTKLFTANGPGANVSVVDIATGKVDKQIATGGSPWGVLVK
jgi:YVTN family beta-propeller protein